MKKLDKETLRAVAQTWISAAKKNIEIAKEKRWKLDLTALLDDTTLRALNVAESILEDVLYKMKEINNELESKKQNGR